MGVWGKEVRKREMKVGLLGMYLIAAERALVYGYVYVYVSCDKNNEEKNLLNCSVPAVSNLHFSISASSSWIHERVR